MPTYGIPERYSEGFQQLLQLDGDTFERVAVAVEAAEPRLEVHMLYHSIAERAGVAYDAVGPALDAVVSTAALGSRDGLTPEEVSRSIAGREVDDQRELFEERLTRLLSADALWISVRAVEIAVGGERLLSSSRVVTDVRPVFAKPGATDLSPNAALIIHRLLLEYFEEGQTRTFSLLMDQEDISILRGHLDRAEAKGQSLVDVLTRADIRYIRGEGEDTE